MDVYFDYCAFIHYVYILYVYACNLWTYLVFILRCNSDGARKVQKHIYRSCLFICLQLVCILLLVANLYATHINYICRNQIFTPLRFFVEKKRRWHELHPFVLPNPGGEVPMLRRWGVGAFCGLFGSSRSGLEETRRQRSSCASWSFLQNFRPKKIQRMRCSPDILYILYKN